MNVEARLARLESQNRWLRGLVVVALLVGAMPWVMASKKQVHESITTKELTIIDEKGLPRGKWYSFNDDESNFVMLEVIGNPKERQSEREVGIALMAGPNASTVLANNGGHAVRKNGKIIWRVPEEK